MHKESPESQRRRLLEEHERQVEYDQVEVVVVTSGLKNDTKLHHQKLLDVRETRKIFPSSPKSPQGNLSFSPKVVFMPHCMFEEEEKVNENSISS